MTEESKRPEPVPAPTPELLLLGVMVRAYMRRLPKRERMQFLEDVTTDLDALAEGVNIHRIRPRSEDAALKRASVLARSWWAKMLSLLVSKMVL